MQWSPEDDLMIFLFSATSEMSYQQTNDIASF